MSIGHLTLRIPLSRLLWSPPLAPASQPALFIYEHLMDMSVTYLAAKVITIFIIVGGVIAAGTLNGQRIICIRRTQYTRSSSGFLTLVYNNVDADGWAICSDLDEWARVPPAFASLSMVNGLPPDVIYDFMIAVQEFPQIKMLMLLP